MAQVAKLTAVLQADSSNFEKGVNRAKVSMKGLNDAAKTMAKATGAAILAVSAAFSALGTSQAKVIDQTAKTADKLGITTEALAGLRLAAEESGVATNTLDMALQRMVRRVAEAAAGTGEAKDALKQLGLDARVLAQQSPDKTFQDIAGAMQDVDNQGEKVRLAFKLFDSEGVALVNTLKLGKEELKQYALEADNLGLAFSRVDAAAVEEANDAMGRVGAVIDGIGNQVATEFSPLITLIANDFVNAATEGEGFGDSISTAMKVAGLAIDAVRKAVIGIELVFAQVSLGIDLMVLDATKALFDLAQAAESIPYIGDRMRGVTQQALNLNRAAQMSASDSLKTINDLQKEVADFETTAERIEKMQVERVRRINSDVSVLSAGSLSLPTTDSADSIKKTKEETKLLTAAKKELTSSAREAFKELEDGTLQLDGLEDGLADILTGTVDLKDGFGNMVDSIISDLLRLSLQRSVIDPLSNALTGAIGGIFAPSTPLAPGASALGQGASLISLPSFSTGSRYIPNDTVARVHKGEMIIPRGDVMGGNTTVNVINNTSSEATVRETNSPRGRSIDVIIDEAVATNISRKGSATQKALNGFNNQTPTRF